MLENNTQTNVITNTAAIIVMNDAEAYANDTKCNVASIATINITILAALRVIGYLHSFSN